MRQRLWIALLLAAAAVTIVATSTAAPSRATLSVGPLPARGLAVATAKATRFLDFKGHELARLPGSYAISRAPHGELLLSRGTGSTLVLRPGSGALAPVAAQTLLTAPRWARRPGCRAAAVHGTTWYLTCHAGIVAVAKDGKPRTIAAQRAPHEWVELFVSPDGKTLLANESRECDGRQAYTLRVAGGPVHRLVNAETTFGAGWTSAGETVVWLPQGGVCAGKSLHPGVYAVGLDGRRRALFAGRASAAATWGS